MNRRVTFLVVAAVVALLAALALFPARSHADVPAVAGREALVFEPVGSSGNPVASGNVRAGSAAPYSPNPSPAAVGSPSPVPSLRRIAAVRVPTASTTAVQRGTASTYGPDFGPGWLAVPQGPGIRVRVCGVARCIERTSTDAGPALSMQRLGRIVDLSVRDFELVTGLDWTRGLAPVSVEVIGD